MNTMGNIIQGILLGDKAVADYIKLVTNSSCGEGIFHETSKKNYRKFNFINNYSRMSSYYNIQNKISEIEIPFKRYFFGDLVSAYNIDGIPIGWSYSTDINKTTLNRGFVSSADFDNFQNLLRGELVSISSTHTYKNGNTYAIEEKDDKGVNTYIRAPKKGVIDTDIKITKNNEGHLVLNNWFNSSRQYKYFDEKEEGSNGIIETNLPQSSVVLIDETQFENNNTSLLLKRTNELFKKGKINSLINRFHTNTSEITGANSTNDLFSSQTQFGISRGRNLLKKEYSNGFSGDKRSGYDNPYCRVWTAHHQYSRLKDRIRPFINENGNFLDLKSIQDVIGDGLRPNNATSRLNKYSVLENTGFVKVTPYNEDNYGDSKIDKKTIMNYMFSIENLAWKDILTNSSTDALSPSQKGPNNGRIMWFPPYNLKFTENVNVNWNGNKFIGRGEQIYTYTDTERSGTLNFTLLIDHPSILNIWRGVDGDATGKELREREESMLRFFAGCEILEGKTKNDDIDKEDVKNEEKKENNITPKPTTKKIKKAYVVFFPNNYSGYDDIKSNHFTNVMLKLCEYETSEDESIWDNETNKPDSSYEGQILLDMNKINKNLYKLNAGGVDSSEIKQILLGNDDDSIELKFLLGEDDNDNLMNINLMNEGDTLFGENKTHVKLNNIEVYGFASSHGYEKENIELVKRRSEFMKKIITDYCDFYTSDIPIIYPLSENLNGSNGIIEVNDIDGRGDVNSFDAKVARSGIIIFNLEKRIDSVPVNITTTDITTNDVATAQTSVNGSVIDYEITDFEGMEYKMNEYKTLINTDYRYDSEYLYFSKIASENDYLLKRIVNRVRHFDPAYHSITPEGFNARLNFLQQCTRQGPTTAVNNGQVSIDSNLYLQYAGNLSFGRAPYCILRIGDFFNTKILIDSISIDYDNGGGTQWDLNPEGAGVQPMMANITMNFKFIGGQDLSGPIERLQNAVSSNFYANTSVYDKNADYEDTRKDLMLE